jgi:hypothetical protein
MDLIELVIHHHCEYIEKWKVKFNRDLCGSIWYIIVEFNNSSLLGPFYMPQDSKFLMSVFGDEYSNFIKYTSKKTMTMGVCYSDLSKKKNMFEFYQQDKKWHFLSNIAYK